jgi:hypothetical protein
VSRLRNHTCWRGVTLALVFMMTAPFESGSSAAGSSLNDTRIVLLDPVTASGLAPGYRIVRTVRRDRCGRGVEDVSDSLFTCGVSAHRQAGPCWPMPQRVRGSHRTAVCLQFPWSKRLVKVEVDQRLVPRRTGAAGGAYPWGVALTDGVECVVFGGAVGSFHGRLEFYNCPHTRLNALSPLSRGQQPWTARTVRFRSHYTHPRKGPTSAISIAYYAADNSEAAARTLPFTGPAIDLGDAAPVGILCVLVGVALTAATKRPVDYGYRARRPNAR